MFDSHFSHYHNTNSDKYARNLQETNQPKQNHSFQYLIVSIYFTTFVQKQGRRYEKLEEVQRTLLIRERKISYSLIESLGTGRFKI